VKQVNITDIPDELAALCISVRELSRQSQYEECEALLKNAMAKYPHNPQPHNLMGLLLELQNDLLLAMKHFRAAWALDPTYIPSRQNLDHFGSFYPTGKWAFDESDCPEEKKQGNYKIEYDQNGIGHIIRRD